jgi:hypothetical protein
LGKRAEEKNLSGIGDLFGREMEVVQISYETWALRFNTEINKATSHGRATSPAGTSAERTNLLDNAQ